MGYDMDGFWQGEEPPMCRYCLDVGMDETPSGYECPACGAGTIWDEENAEWLDYELRTEREVFRKTS